MSLCACLIISCATEKYERKAFKYQVLIANPKYPGSLVNQFPREDETWDVKEYSFKDKTFRNDADMAGFWCLFGKKRWYVCPKRPGLCRRTKECDKWERKYFKKKCVLHHVLYLDGEKDFQTIVRMRPICRVLHQK